MAERNNKVGRFELGGRIAAGGMATVHVAEAPLGDRLSGCPLALKILHDHLADESDFVRMFLDEGKIASRMAHPGIVRVYEVGEADGRHYIAMERVDGYNLAQVLTAHRAANKRFPAAAVFSVLRQVLGALAYVHGFSDKRGRNIGIVHRDISPQNILIGRDEKLRVADFGIARGGHRAEKTRTGTVKGKLHYMAPEQARGKRVDARADLYALGAVAFELWTRQPLHDADKTEVLHQRAASGAINFERPEFLKLHGTVRKWLRTSLDPDPDLRFQSAIEMLGAMENVSGAGRARFKPGTLTRVMNVADAYDAEAAGRGPQYLFSSDEMAQTTRKSDVRKRSITPGEPMSGAFLGVSGVSRRELQPSNRLSETHGVPDWEAAPPPMPAASRSRSRASEPSVNVLPVERVAATSGVYRRQRRATQSVSELEIDAETVAKKRRSRPIKRAKDSKKAAPATAGKRSSTTAKPVAKTKKSSAKKPRQTEKRLVVQQQRSLAAASVVMWSSVALLLFAMLLESWNARIDFPTVDDRTFAGWFNGAQVAQAEPEGETKVKPKRWPTKLPEVRNDRFLPRRAAPRSRAPRTRKPRLATAPTQG